MKCADDSKYKLYRIKWVDSSRFTTWMNLSDLPDKHTCNCVTVGYVVKRTKKAIYVSGSIDLSNGNFCMVMEIPRCAITKMRGIKKNGYKNKINQR